MCQQALRRSTRYRDHAHAPRHGGRLSEVAGLRVDDVDFDLDVLHVMGKGRRVGNRSLFPLAAASGIMAVVVPCHSASARASPWDR